MSSALPFARRAPRSELRARALVGVRRRRGARRPALARRRRDRRRRPLPPRARAQAGGVRLALARRRERVRGRRPASRLRLPALARLPRARRAGVLPRPLRGRPARGLGARAARAARRLRGRVRALPRASGRRSRSSAPQVGVTALAPRHGGAYTALALPATASRQLLVPAAIALALAYVERPTRGVLASAAAAGLVLAVVHPTYAIFLWVPFAGFLARPLAGRPRGGEADRGCARRARRAGGRISRLAAPGRSRHRLARARRRTSSQRAFVAVRGPARRRRRTRATASRPRSSAGRRDRRRGAPASSRSPGSRCGAAGRRTSLGGFLAVAAVMLVPPLFVAVSDLVSISQSRRAAGFWPLAFAFAGGFAVLAALLRWLVLPLALAGRDRAPARLSRRLRLRAARGRAGARHLVRGRRRRRRARARPVRGVRRRAAGWVVGVAAALFVLPIAVHAAWNWSPSEARRPSPLTPGLVEALREDVPEGDVVYSDLETSYRIAAEAPVYIAAAPPGHVADTEENRPYERRDENMRFFRHRRPRDSAPGGSGLARGRPASLRRRSAARLRLSGRAATRSTSSRSRSGQYHRRA